MIMPFHIRPAQLDDFDALMPLWCQLDDFHHKQDPVRFPKRKAETPRSLAYVQELVERPDRALLVAEGAFQGEATLKAAEQSVPEGEGPCLLGLSSIIVRTYPAGPIFPARVLFEIDNLVVDEAARRCGIARALIRGAENWSRAHGAGEVILNVYDFNDQARSFYEQIGFLSSKTQMVRSLY